MDTAVRGLLDKQEIGETISRLFIGTDRRDWEAGGERRCKSGGGGSGTGPGRRARWGRPRHHQAGNLLAEVRGDLATAFCYGIASHYLSHRSGRNTRTFVGSYDFSLVRIEGRWRISAFKFNLKYIDGNKDLESDSRD